MKIGPQVTVDWKLVLAGGFVVAGLYYMLTRDAVKAGAAVAETVGDAAKAVGTAANPLSRDNIVQSGITAVGQAVGDNAYEQKHWSLGGQFYDWFNDMNTTEGDFSTNNPYVTRR